MSKNNLLRKPHRLSGCLMIVFCLLLSSGCAGTHLYNKANHEMAIKAEKSFKEAELSKSLVKERERLSELIKRENEVVRRHTLARRNIELMSFIGGENKAKSWDSIESEIDNRLKVLIGNNDTNKEDFIEDTTKSHDITNEKKNEYIAKFLTFATQLHRMDVNIESIKEDYNLNGPGKNDPKLALKKKDITLDDMEFSKEVLKEIYTAYIRVHNKRLAFSKELDKFGGEYWKAKYEYEACSLALKDVNGELKRKKKVYEDELKEYKKTLKDNRKSISTIAKELNEKLEKFDDFAKYASKGVELLGLEDLKLLGHIEKLEEQKKHISKVLESVSTPDGESSSGDDMMPDIKISLGFASTINSLDKLYTQLGKYPLYALVFQNERLRIEIDSLKKRVTNKKEYISLIQRKQDAIWREVIYLVSAQTQLKEAKKIIKSKGLPGGESIANIFSDRNLGCREVIGKMFLSYANSWSIGRLAQEEIDYLIIGNRHKTSLDGSEIALAQWENLIGVPITQLVALHGAGLTPDEIAKLGLGVVNLAGLTAIAANVD